MTWKAWLISAAVVALLSACGKPAEKKAETPSSPAATPAPPVQPQRKAGLWNQTVATKDMTQTFRICLDTETSKKLSMFGQQTSDQACPKTSMTRAADGSWDFSSSCDMGSAGHIETRGVATGDLTSKYAVKATSVTTGAATPEANGTTEMNMTAEWAGPCPPDFKPGDMELPGGMRMNIGQMEQQSN